VHFNLEVGGADALKVTAHFSGEGDCHAASRK